MIRKFAALALLAVLAAPLPALAAKAPTVALQSLAGLPTPLPYPYDEAANAEADVAAAIKKAKREHKLLLLDFGGNWCPDCRIFAGLIEQPDLKAFVDKHYVVQTVDVGRSLAQDRKRPAKAVAKKGHGDKGDRNKG